MKKKVAMLLAAAVIMSAMPVSAQEYTKVNLLVDGESVVTDQSAVIVDSRTLVPVRVIAEKLGSKVDWDANTKTVTFTYGDTTAAFEINGKVLKVTKDGVSAELPIDVPATIINSRTMVPVRFLSENLGYKVDWDAQTKTVNVTSASATASDETASGSAAQYEGMADRELRDDAETADGYAAILNGYTDKMTKEQADLYEKYCDNVSTVFQFLDTGKYTQSEIEAGAKAVAEAKEGMEKIAKELDVDLTAKDTKADEAEDVKALREAAETVDAYTAILNDRTDDMSEEQAKDYEKYCDDVSTVFQFLDTGKYTQSEIDAGTKAVAEAKEGMEKIAEDIKADLTGEYAIDTMMDVKVEIKK